MGWNKDGSFTLDGPGTYTGIGQSPIEKERKKKREEEKKKKKK